MEVAFIYASVRMCLKHSNVKIEILLERIVLGSKTYLCKKSKKMASADEMDQITLEKKLILCEEANRRATFKTWVFNKNVKCNANKLAEAGFFFTGTNIEPDSVTCFFCDKSLDCWEEDDDPWLEHFKHAPYCSFAKLAKPELAQTLSEVLDLKNELVMNFLKKQFASITENMDPENTPIS